MNKHHAERIASAAIMTTIILFIGYMCEAPITTPSSDNFLSYIFALIFGGIVYLRPWKL